MNWDARDLAQYNVLRRRYLTLGGTGPNAAVGAAATTLAVTFARQEPDVSYGVLATPSWDTRVWITTKAVTGFTINFSGAPGGAGGTVDWITFRSET